MRSLTANNSGREKSEGTENLERPEDVDERKVWLIRQTPVTRESGFNGQADAG